MTGHACVSHHRFLFPDPGVHTVVRGTTHRMSTGTQAHGRRPSHQAATLGMRLPPTCFRLPHRRSTIACSRASRRSERIRAVALWHHRATPRIHVEQITVDRTAAGAAARLRQDAAVGFPIEAVAINHRWSKAAPSGRRRGVGVLFAESIPCAHAHAWCHSFPTQTNSTMSSIRIDAFSICFWRTKSASSSKRFVDRGDTPLRHTISGSDPTLRRHASFNEKHRGVGMPNGPMVWWFRTLFTFQLAQVGPMLEAAAIGPEEDAKQCVRLGLILVRRAATLLQESDC